jgi:hypothetical protein
MKHRFNVNDLTELSDKQILMILINERLSELNQHSLLGARLDKIAEQLRKEMT